MSHLECQCCIGLLLLPIAHALIGSIIFFEFSFHLTSIFPLLRYYPSSFCFVSLSLIRLPSYIPKYLYPAVSVNFFSSPCSIFKPFEYFVFPHNMANTMHLSCLHQTLYLYLSRMCAVCSLKFISHSFFSYSFRLAMENHIIGFLVINAAYCKVFTCSTNSQNSFISNWSLVALDSFLQPFCMLDCNGF